MPVVYVNYEEQNGRPFKLEVVIAPSVTADGSADARLKAEAELKDLYEHAKAMIA